MKEKLGNVTMNANLRLNVDTGAGIGPDGIDACYLGKGFKFGRKVGVSTPLGGVSL